MPEKPTLPFPLDPNTRHSLKNGGFIITGRVSLSSGSVTVSDPRIRASSLAFVTYDETDTALSSSGTLSVTVADGSLTIDSTNGSDASDVSYLIIV